MTATLRRLRLTVPILYVAVVQTIAANSACAQHHDYTDANISDVRVAPGSEKEAKEYYDRIETLLGIILTDNQSKVPLLATKATTLDGLLVYLGYQNESGYGLRARHLEDIDSFVLMPTNAKEFDALNFNSGQLIGKHLTLNDFHTSSGPQPVLVTRFFAPKIAKYFNSGDEAQFEPVDPDTIVPGWRKVVRLIPRKNSPAESKVKRAFILFNFKKANADVDPFLGNSSANNQVILVPKDYDPLTKKKDAAFFAVYESREKSYQLGFFLGADFDLPGHVAYQSGGGLAKDSEYYVPTACAACHGHGDLRGAPNENAVFDLAKPNYLDTDQWYDWMDFDFRGVAGSLNDVVFDGGKDHSSTSYSQAVNVVAALNEEIKVDTEVTGKSFALTAVTKWLELHKVKDGMASDPHRKPYSMRAFEAPPNGWDPYDARQMRLLRLLNNHCFRCHSSMIYNVFDKKTVGSLAEAMKVYLNETQVDPASGKPLPGFTMPQGRVLSGATRVEFVTLLNDVFPTATPIYGQSYKNNLVIVARNYAFRIDGKDNPPLVLTAGQTLSLSMTSAGGTHDWQLETDKGIVIEQTKTVSGSTPVTLTWPTVVGDYKYFCGVKGHRKLGMEGNLQVIPAP